MLPIRSTGILDIVQQGTGAGKSIVIVVDTVLSSRSSWWANIGTGNRAHGYIILLFVVVRQVYFNTNAPNTAALFTAIAGLFAAFRIHIVAHNINRVLETAMSALVIQSTVYGRIVDSVRST